DDLRTGRRRHIAEAAELVVADVASAAAVDDVVRSGFDAVCHIAGQASISRSFDDPGANLSTNVVGTLNVVQACRAHGVPRLVFASSMTAYGEPDRIPTPESAPCLPVSYYGITKFAAERYVQIAGELGKGDLSVTSLRMFNVYGERQSLTNPYQGVLAVFL